MIGQHAGKTHAGGDLFINAIPVKDKARFPRVPVEILRNRVVAITQGDRDALTCLDRQRHRVRGDPHSRRNDHPGIAAKQNRLLLPLQRGGCAAGRDRGRVNGQGCGAVAIRQGDAQAVPAPGKGQRLANGLPGDAVGQAGGKVEFGAPDGFRTGGPSRGPILRVTHSGG